MSTHPTLSSNARTNKHRLDTSLRKSHRTLRAITGISRFRILSLLKTHKGSLNVTSIAERLGVSCSLVSHEMRILREYKLVSSVTKGREVFYLASDRMEKLFPLLER